MHWKDSIWIRRSENASNSLQLWLESFLENGCCFVLSKWTPDCSNPVLFLQKSIRGTNKQVIMHIFLTLNIAWGTQAIVFFPKAHLSHFFSAFIGSISFLCQTIPLWLCNISSYLQSFKASAKHYFRSIWRLFFKNNSVGFWSNVMTQVKHAKLLCHQFKKKNINLCRPWCRWTERVCRSCSLWSVTFIK